MRAAEFLLELLFPRKCILCGKILHREETDLCTACRRETERYAPAGRKLPRIRTFTALWYYEDTVRKSLIRYKFNNVRSYADGYGRMLGMKILEDLEQPDLLTWIPVSARRKRRRGYDQVELIARAVSRETGIPCSRLLRKIRDNRAQSSLEKAEQRRANVLGAYRAAEGVAGKKILLLDDILTTGATASECARVLLTAGAKEVTFAAVAAGRNHAK